MCTSCSSSQKLSEAPTHLSSGSTMHLSDFGAPNRTRQQSVVLRLPQSTISSSRAQNRKPAAPSPLLETTTTTTTTSLPSPTTTLAPPGLTRAGQWQLLGSVPRQLQKVQGLRLPICDNCKSYGGLRPQNCDSSSS